MHSFDGYVVLSWGLVKKLKNIVFDFINCASFYFLYLARICLTVSRTLLRVELTVLSFIFFAHRYKIIVKNENKSYYIRYLGIQYIYETINFISLITILALNYVFLIFKTVKCRYLHKHHII